MVNASLTTARTYYQDTGAALGHYANPWFDAAWYLQTHDSARAAVLADPDLTALEYYWTVGRPAGDSPSAAIDLDAYVAETSGLAGRIAAGQTTAFDWYMANQNVTAAVADAQIGNDAEISRDLLAMTGAQAGLEWSGTPGDSLVKVITLAEYSGYDAEAVGTTAPAPIPIWVTVPTQLQTLVAERGLTIDSFATGIREIMGFPPDKNIDRVAELWVDPDTLFRPAADPDVTDHETTLGFPMAGGEVLAPEAHQAWYHGNGENTWPWGYPWTRLGYTYDWGNDAGEIGASEFVLGVGQSYTLAGVASFDDFFGFDAGRSYDYSGSTAGVALTLGSGDDTATGGAGNDTLAGGDGWDILDGGAGDDLLHGGLAPSDYLSAVDLLRGGAGRDSLHGADGGDDLSGGAGDDLLSGGAGTYTLAGGDGADIHVFATGDGRDLITDFAAGEDHLRVTGVSDIDALAATASNDSAGQAVITWGQSWETVTLAGIDASQVTTDFFLAG